VSHAKFVIIDHSIMLRTSANFSYSAEHLNREFGVLIEDQGSLIPSKIWHSKHGVKHGGLYEMV